MESTYAVVMRRTSKMEMETLLETKSEGRACNVAERVFGRYFLHQIAVMRISIVGQDAKIEQVLKLKRTCDHEYQQYEWSVDVDMQRDLKCVQCGCSIESTPAVLSLEGLEDEKR